MISEDYVLEYGTDRLQMHVGAVLPGDRAIVIDDMVATGGTLSAAIKLLGMGLSYLILSLTLLYISIRWSEIVNFLERAGGEVVECGCVIGVPEVKVMLEQIPWSIIWKCKLAGVAYSFWSNWTK